MTGRFSKNSFLFWVLAAVFFTCTWDTILKLDLGGFTLKIYQPLCALGLGLLVWNYRDKSLTAFSQALNKPFAACMFLLGIFYLGTSPWSAFPLKSTLYSAWLIFDLLALWLFFQFALSATPATTLLTLIWKTMLFLSAVVLVDHLAYPYGYRGGLIGGNQDVITALGLSRPHAFSSEPSYIATFLCLGILTSTASVFQAAKRKWLFCLELLIVLLALFATASRTGWISLALGVLIFLASPLLIGKKIQLQTVGKAFGVAIFVVTLFLLATPRNQLEVMHKSFVASIFQGNDGSGNARLRAHLMAFQLAKETNLVGTGLASSYKYYKDHGGQDQAAPHTFNVNYYGNELIMSTWGQLLAEGGPIAVLLYLAAGFFLIRSLFRKWKQNGDSLALGSLVASSVFFLFTAFWLGNVCRGDIWVWYAIWSAVGTGKTVT